MRDMDSGTKSQFAEALQCGPPRLPCAGKRAAAPIRHVAARLAYTIARHSLRSLDTLEKLLLQVTRKNDPRGYERFRDLFEAIVAYNE